MPSPLHLEPLVNLIDQATMTPGGSEALAPVRRPFGAPSLPLPQLTECGLYDVRPPPQRHVAGDRFVEGDPPGK